MHVQFKASPHLPALLSNASLVCCSGQVQLDITWEASARSVLTTKLRALERVLAQRQEILAALRPVPAAVVRGWEVPEQGTLQVRGRAGGWAAWQKATVAMRNGKSDIWHMSSQPFARPG